MSPTERAQSNIGDVADKIAETLAQSAERALRAEQLAWDLAKALRALVTPIGGELGAPVGAPFPSELDAAHKALGAFDAAVAESLVHADCAQDAGHEVRR